MSVSFWTTLTRQLITHDFWFQNIPKKFLMYEDIIYYSSGSRFIRTLCLFYYRGQQKRNFVQFLLSVRKIVMRYLTDQNSSSRTCQQLAAMKNDCFA